MSVAAMQFLRTHESECKGPPPLPSDMKRPSIDSALISLEKLQEANGNVIALLTSKLDHSSATRGPEYDLADRFDQLLLHSELTDDHQSDLEERGSGRTKRSSSKSSTTQDDSDTTTPKKRHQASHQEPCHPPVHLPMKYSTRVDPPHLNNFISQSENMTEAHSPQEVAGTSRVVQAESAPHDTDPGNHLNLIRSGAACFQSSDMERIQQRGWNSPGKEMDLDSPVQGSDASLSDAESLSCGRSPTDQSLGPGESSDGDVFQTACSSVPGTPPRQFPSVGHSPSWKGDLAFDVEPDGMAINSEEHSLKIQKIIQYLDAPHSQSLAQSGVGEVCSEADMILQTVGSMEDQVLTVKANLWNQLTVSASSSSSSSSSSQGTVLVTGIEDVSSVCVTGPPVNTSVVGPHPVSIFSNKPVVSGVSVAGLYCGPPHNTPGPSQPVPFSVSGPPVTVSSRTSPKVGNVASNPSSSASDVGSAAVSQMAHGSGARLPDLPIFVASSSPSCASPEERSEYGGSSSNVSDNHASCYPVATCLSSSQSAGSVQTQQTWSLSGRSVTSVDKSQCGLDKFQRNSSSSSSPHSSLPGCPSFSSNSVVSKDVKKSPQVDSPMSVHSSPEHTPLSSSLFRTPIGGSPSTSRMQSSPDCVCCDEQSLEAGTQQTLNPNIHPSTSVHPMTTQPRPLLTSLKVPGPGGWSVNRSACAPLPTTMTTPVPRCSHVNPQQHQSGRCQTSTNLSAPGCSSSPRDPETLSPRGVQKSATLVNTGHASLVKSFSSPFSSLGSTAAKLPARRCSSNPHPVRQPVSGSFLDIQTDVPCPTYPTPVFLGKIPGTEADTKEGIEGRSLAQWFENDEVSDEVLEAVCDETGVWLTDNEGDTFLHSLSGWENEEAAVDAVYRVKDKPNFLYALNQYNRNSETPLYSAVCLRKPNLVERFLDYGARVDSLCCFEAQVNVEWWVGG
ncbi:uncharacterized protein LOC143291664 [Babylonia areolata]|uniref:uncharacterized protein LOC143291664 n=1 Tax=Babylonia areolata TaxID=304850 RepID=UPI003FD20F5B